MATLSINYKRLFWFSYAITINFCLYVSQSTLLLQRKLLTFAQCKTTRFLYACVCGWSQHCFCNFPKTNLYLTYMHTLHTTQKPTHCYNDVDLTKPTTNITTKSNWQKYNSNYNSNGINNLLHLPLFNVNILKTVIVVVAVFTFS